MIDKLRDLKDPFFKEFQELQTEFEESLKKASKVDIDINQLNTILVDGKPLKSKALVYRVNEREFKISPWSKLNLKSLLNDIVKVTGLEFDGFQQQNDYIISLKPIYNEKDLILTRINLAKENILLKFKNRRETYKRKAQELMKNKEIHENEFFSLKKYFDQKGKDFKDLVIKAIN